MSVQLQNDTSSKPPKLYEYTTPKPYSSDESADKSDPLSEPL
jgi:hypothetical protein